ncbi:hypothetical protein [Pedobacter hartonius]|uniref:hypothetical protein n=1 Tax=Pedobacter hartonius TaxID=425514 RepID=UPI00111506BB|nr:hypothetical protein [Pedobacter hartonius]
MIYLYFQDDDGKSMSKVTRNAVKTDVYTIYWYLHIKQDKDHIRRYAFCPIDESTFEYKDEKFVKTMVTTIDKVKNIPCFGYDTTDKKRFPFSKIYIVEYIKPDQYKMVEVNSYIGSDYF